MHEQSIIQLIGSNCDQIHQLEQNSSSSYALYVKAITQQKLLQCNAILNYLEDNFLPSGSGFDQASTINRVSSGLNRVVIDTSFHHMDEHGFYDRWTYHSVHCIPDFSSDGFSLLVKGKDYRDIKKYIHEVFTYALATEIPDDDIKAIISQSEDKALLAVEKTKDHAKP